MSRPTLRFLSLFVADLERAAQNYSAALGVEPMATPALAPMRHPFSPAPPVVFDLGGVELALYQVDANITHEGDVGIGVESADPQALLHRVADVGGQTLVDSTVGDTTMSVFVMPDRHFFEVVPDFVGGST